MFRPHKGICTHCNEMKLIVVKAGFCAYCNHEIKQEKKGGQLEKDKDEVFYQLAWMTKPHQCEECKLPLQHYNRMFISHIISKGANTKLRRDLRNFNILCADHHQQWEFGDRKAMKIYLKNETIKKYLTLEYYDNKRNDTAG